jgi:adenylate kinase
MCIASNHERSTTVLQTTLTNSLYECWIRIGRVFHPDRSEAMFILMQGKPGAGKGTLAVMVAERLELPHLNMGDIIRRKLAADPEFKAKYGASMKAGHMLPDWVIVKLLKEELRKPEYARGAVCDGVPRTVLQAVKLRRWLASRGNRIDVVLFLDVSDADLIDRLSLRLTCSGKLGDKPCGHTFNLKLLPPAKEGICDYCGSALIVRDDQKPEAIKTRMAEFTATSAPLKAYYEGQGRYMVLEVTNEMSPQDVYEAALFAIDEIDQHQPLFG